MNQFREQIYELRAQVLRTIDAHEKEAHGGEVCKLERVNLVAFICHSLLLEASDFPAIAHALSTYDERHDAQKEEGASDAE